ncbi:MAG: chemotaxis protein CheC [Erysipelotrichales bacterium]|nr:chemotaxis protein CheC [Erysipelotrichales bacterium]
MSINRNENSKLDFLLEIGNIGSGNALTSLAEFIDRRVDMKAPRLEFVDFNELFGSVGGVENVVSGFLINVHGDVNGIMLFLLQNELASEVCDILLGSKLIDLNALDELHVSLFKEIANIMAGSYISALAEMTGLKITTSVPDLAIDMAGAILSVPLIHFENVFGQILLIQNSFSVDLKEYNSSIFFFLEDESIAKLMKQFGIE